MTLLPNEGARTMRLLVRQRIPVSDLFHVLTFDGTIAAQAGQFAMIRGAAWGAAPLLPRPMSLLTGGERPSILVKVVGEGTRRLALAAPGEAFDLVAPLGVPFEMPAAGSRALLVAEGVGVAPLLFLARQIAVRSPGSEPMALYGAPTSTGLPLGAELAEVAELRLATEDGSRGAHAHVTALVDPALEELAARPEEVIVYACGSEPMMAAVASICAARGVRCQVRLETRMACGYGACLGCAVPRAAGGTYLYACTEGPCVDATSIAWKRAVSP